MDIPLNIFHNYIGMPVLLGLAIDSIHRYRNTQNITAAYVGLSCLLATLSTMFFGIPVLFTHDAHSLSVGTYIGDVLLSLCMLVFWLFVIRSFLSTRPRLAFAARILVVILTLGIIVEGVFRDLMPPYGAQAVLDMNGRVAVEYKQTLFYSIASALDSLVLAFIGIFFYRQARAANTLGQRIRIRGLSVSFICFSSAFAITPIFPLQNQPLAILVLLSIGLINIMITGLVGMSIDRMRRTPTSPN